MRNLHSMVKTTICRLVHSRDNAGLFHHGMLPKTRFFRRFSAYCVSLLAALLLMFPPIFALGQLEIEFEAVPDEPTGTDFTDADFVDMNAISPTVQQPVEQLTFVQPSVVPLTPLQSTGNSGIANAAYVAVVPSANGGTQYIAPVNGIVLPQAYWNAPNVTTAASPPLGSTAVNNATLVAVPITSNGLQLANWNGTAVGNPIRLASGSADGTTDTAYLLSTNTGTQFGSIPSGTAVTLLAQAPGYAPIDSLSPATNPAPAGSGFAGPYNYSNSNISATAGQSYDPNFRSALSERYDSMMSFMNNLTVNALWMPDSGSNGLGNTELRGQARFAIPCQMLGNEMFYVVPGFQVNFWEINVNRHSNGFKSTDTTFGAWLDAGIEPQIGNEFRFDLWARVGVYTDFEKIKSDSIYLSGLGRVYYQYSNNLELMGGVIYMNRERIRLMPTFGVIWKPSEYLICEIVFPTPKISRYIYTTNDTEWWAYVRGDYGGGSWGIDTGGYGVERIDYNDIRVALGLEFRNKPKQCLSGHFEIGGAFNRELYSGGHAFYKPSSCVFIAGGLKY